MRAAIIYQDGKPRPYVPPPRPRIQPGALNPLDIQATGDRLYYQGQTLDPWLVVLALKDAQDKVEQLEARLARLQQPAPPPEAD